MIVNFTECTVLCASGPIEIIKFWFCNLFYFCLTSCFILEQQLDILFKGKTRFKLAIQNLHPALSTHPTVKHGSFLTMKSMKVPAYQSTCSSLFKPSTWMTTWNPLLAAHLTIFCLKYGKAKIVKNF